MVRHGHLRRRKAAHPRDRIAAEEGCEVVLPGAHVQPVVLYRGREGALHPLERRGQGATRPRGVRLPERSVNQVLGAADVDGPWPGGAQEWSRCRTRPKTLTTPLFT